jgi:Tfp pilus assembly major pilin PilA
MIVNVAYTLVFNTGLFPDACRAWKSRAIAVKTWAQFKIDFATAHGEFRLTNQTAHQSSFHSANMMIEQTRDDYMQETSEAIAQMDTAMSSDRGTVAMLTTTNAKLANQLEAANALIAQLKSEIATLKIKINPVWQGQRPARTTNNDSYCWSHGYQVARSHTSATCNVRKSGHQEAATKSIQWEAYTGAKNDTEGQLRT